MRKGDARPPKQGEADGVCAGHEFPDAIAGLSEERLVQLVQRWILSLKAKLRVEGKRVTDSDWVAGCLHAGGEILELELSGTKIDRLIEVLEGQRYG